MIRRDDRDATGFVFFSCSS